MRIPGPREVDVQGMTVLKALKHPSELRTAGGAYFSCPLGLLGVDVYRT